MSTSPRPATTPRSTTTPRSATSPRSTTTPRSKTQTMSKTMSKTMSQTLSPRNMGNETRRGRQGTPKGSRTPRNEEPPDPNRGIDLDSERVSDMVPRLKALLKHRDEALVGERKQVRLYEAKNEVLRANLDQVEAEVGSLQSALMQANDKMSASMKERRRLEKRITSLEAMLAGVKGQEYAINVATNQNTKLVLLLQEEERKQKELEDERQGHVDEIAGLRAKLNLATRDFSAVEAKLKEQLGRRTHQLDKLTSAHEKLAAEHAELGRKYEDETTDLRARLAELQKIVHQLKGQPYKLLDRLQKSEDLLRASRDDTERVQQEVRLLNEQNAELSRHLEDAVTKGNGYKDRMEALQKTIPPLEKEIATLRTKLDYERRDKLQVEGQVFELSQSVAQLVQRQAVVEEKAIAKDKELARAMRAREQECMGLEQQLAARERLLVKHEKAIQVLHEGLAEAQAEADGLRLQVQGAAKDVALAYRLDVQRHARRRLLELHVHCVSSLTFAEPHCEAVLQAVGQLAVLDLSGGGLSNDDLRFVLENVQRCPMVRVLDLGSNAITDQGSPALAEFLRDPSCALERLVLTGNQLTAQGIRRMAVALEGNRARGVRSVVLRKEGVVEAFGTAPPRRSVSHARVSLSESSGTERTSDCPTEAAASCAPAVSSAEGRAGAGAGGVEAQGESQPSVPIIVIDARDNLLGPRKVDDVPSDALTQAHLRQQLSPGHATSGKAAQKPMVTARNNQGPTSASVTKQIQEQRDFRNKVTAEVYTGRQRPKREK